MTDRLLILSDKEEAFLRWALNVWEDTFRGVLDDHVVEARHRHDAIFRQLDGAYTEEQKDQMLNVAAELALPTTFKRPAHSPPGAS